MQNLISEEKFFQGVVQCSAAQDLTRVFTLAGLVEMTRAGFLQQWLAENFSEPDVIAGLLNNARVNLMRVLGLDASDELLDFMFKRFCVGK